VSARSRSRQKPGSKPSHEASQLPTFSAFPAVNATVQLPSIIAIMWHIVKIFLKIGRQDAYRVSLFRPLKVRKSGVDEQQVGWPLVVEGPIRGSFALVAKSLQRNANLDAATLKR